MNARGQHIHYAAERLSCDRRARLSQRSWEEKGTAMEFRRYVISFTATFATPLAVAAGADVPASQPQPSTPSVESARPGTGGGPPPPYSVVRWNEDYSYLKDPARRGDFFDPIKYIPLNEKGDWYLS